MTFLATIAPAGPLMILTAAALLGCTGSVLIRGSGSTTSGSTSSSTSTGTGGHGSIGISSSSTGGATAADCEALEMTATQQLEAVVDQNLSCSVDADCVEISVGPGGFCAAPCGVLTDKSGAEAVQTAANSACEPFLAAGCTPPFLGCPAFPPFLCAGGTCATYSLAVTPSPPPTFTAGACAVLHLAYSTGTGATDAHDAVAVLMQASIGTVYADAACTTPVTTGSPEMTGTLTIPAGSSSVDFGFMSGAPGIGWLNVGAGIGGAQYRVTVQ